MIRFCMKCSFKTFRLLFKYNNLKIINDNVLQVERNLPKTVKGNLKNGNLQRTVIRAKLLNVLDKNATIENVVLSQETPENYDFKRQPDRLSKKKL